MTVLVTTDAVGGVWTVSLDLAAGLAGLGNEVTLAVLGPPPRDDQRAAARAIAGVTLHEWTGRLEWMPQPWADVEASGRWLVALAARVRPDVVHVNGYAHAACPFAAPVVVGAHSCVASWFAAVHGRAAPPEWDTYMARVRQGLDAAAVVVAPSLAMARALIVHYAPRTPIVTIANGRTIAPPTAAKAPFVLSAGRAWDEAKNLRRLGEAAADIPWPVYVAGDGAETIPGVTALGHVPADAMAGWMARASIFALPTRYEPFGLAALEAGLAGSALVLGDIQRLRDSWEGAATFVPPDDAAGLAAALRALIEDEARRRAAGRSARRRARRYSATAMVERYAALYARLGQPTVPSEEVPCAS